MPILTNPKYERFAQELARGKTAEEAYQDAGYKAHRQNAHRLMTNDDVRRRVSELQSRASDGLVITLQWLVEKAEEARSLAMANGQTSAAVAAIKELGVLSGKRVERSENGNPGDFDRMSDDELAEFVRREGAVVSKEVH
jgi:phage terminase small subunit